MERADYYVYVLFRETGIPFYIGKGSGQRWMAHEGDAKRGEDTHKARIIREMQRSGLEVPKVKVVEGLTESEAHETEVALIAAIGRRPSGILVNNTAGGEGLSKPDPETREKMRRARLGRKTPDHVRAQMSIACKGMGLGRKMTPEQCAKMSAAKKGVRPSPETSKKIADANRGKKRGPVSQETRAKLSSSHIGKQHKPGQTEKTAASNRGKIRTDEWKAQQALRMKAWWSARVRHPLETIERMRASRLRYLRSKVDAV